jgi:AcrR family transcriptional regulator
MGSQQEPMSRQAPKSEKRRSRLRPDDRRDHLIRTAVTLFADEGVAATSIVRLTQAAEVSNGIFYHYFANKQELEDAVAQVVIDDLVARLAVVQQTKSYADRIAMGAVGTMRAVAANRELGAITAQYLDERHDVLERSPIQLESDITEGAHAGEFAVAEPFPLLVNMLVATLAVGARSVLAGADADDIGESIAAAHLRILGIPRKRASLIASRAKAMPSLP